MRPVLTAEQSRHQDSLALEDPDVLLDRAGLAVALAAVRLGATYGYRVAVLAGPGNNGGDGYVAAQYLRRRGVAVDLYPFSDPKTDVAAAARIAALSTGAMLRDWGDARPADLVVDALFGGGFRGELPDLDAWRGVDATLAVDVASGLNASTGEAAPATLRADASVTFHGLKVGHLIGAGPDLSGEVQVVDIGLPDVTPEFQVCDEVDAPLPRRDRDAHKWSAGSVLVVGGSAGLDGAVKLTATAALRAGAGAVMIACPPGVEERIRAPEIMTRAVGQGQSFSAGDSAEILTMAERFDVVAIGPGLGPDVGGFVESVMAGSTGRIVADADALNAIDASLFSESSRRNGDHAPRRRVRTVDRRECELSDCRRGGRGHWGHRVTQGCPHIRDGRGAVGGDLGWPGAGHHRYR